jgi:hypothetical protein
MYLSSVTKADVADITKISVFEKLGPYDVFNYNND